MMSRDAQNAVGPYSLLTVQHCVPSNLAESVQRTWVHEWVDEPPPAQIHVQDAEGASVGDFVVSAAYRVTGGDDQL